MAFPKCVIDAKKIDFGVQVTGYLCCAEVQSSCVVGVVFSETSGRFIDGLTIRSSDLQRVFEFMGYKLCETSSGSRYVVCHWWYENGALPMLNIIH